jgi:putative transposase
MLKAYQYRLYPTKAQERLMLSTLETCRRWYNECLAERKTAWEERRESIGKFAQLRKVKDIKRGNPFASPIHSHVLQIVVQDLDKAFQAFFRRLKSGETPGYPRFKSRDRFDSFGFKEYGNGFRLDGRRLKLSGMGRVRVRWHRPVEGTIKTARIVRKAGQWFVSFACEVEGLPLPLTGQEVGIDVGIHHLLATSEGETIENPRWYREDQKHLRVLQRRVSRRIKGSAGRREAVQLLCRQHERIANQRKDYWNKLAHGLVERYDRIVLEDLQIVNMAQNRHLSKSILDASWGYFKLHLMHKAAEAGREVILVAPAYTSQECSRCGTRFEGLTLQDRWVECGCGLTLDRDHNAAINILNRAGRARGSETWPVAACVLPEAPGL